MNIFNSNQENDYFLSNNDNVKQEQKNQQSMKKILSEFNNNNAETTTETKTEKDEFGNENIICIRYDKNHKIISKKITCKNNNSNNNISQNDNNNINNNYHREFFKASNGFTLETITEKLANGRKKQKKIMRDNNNKIIEIKEREIRDNSNRRNNGINFNINNRVRHVNHNMNNNNNNLRILPINNNMHNMRRNINHNGQMPNPYMNRRNINNRMMNNNPVNNMNNMNNFMRNNMNILPNPFMNNQFFNMVMPFPIPFPLFHRSDANRIDQNILNSLPESEVKDASKMDDENKNCVICLEDFIDKEKIICLPCIHVFHSECIKSWLGSHNECPICKYKLTYENINRH